MPLYPAIRVKVSTSSSGLSNFTLGGAVSAAFQSFGSAGIPNGATIDYTASTATQFESGTGVFTSPSTLSRDTILASSNAGAKVNFSSSPTVFITLLPDRVNMTGRKTLWIGAGAMQSRTTAGAINTTREINGITVGVQRFDPSVNVGVNFSFSFPKAWNAGPITYQVHWTADSGSGTVEFELRGGCFANDAPINVTGLGTAVAVVDTLLAANDEHITPESAAVTLANAADNTLAIFELIRDQANDTLGALSGVIGVSLFYTINAGNDE